MNDTAVFEPLSRFKRQEQALAKTQRTMINKTSSARAVNGDRPRIVGLLDGGDSGNQSWPETMECRPGR
ncbi:hypothetical protein [uncultured Thiocystis sp.]|uniref:hypothetical protein n=1 Tax=uncultured Thiocystis sp. TaxID=1202134 RepID=UPI0025FDF7C8|nr:hypothetical protein [uncultured Thiocystis sp.]